MKRTSSILSAAILLVILCAGCQKENLPTAAGTDQNVLVYYTEGGVAKTALLDMSPQSDSLLHHLISNVADGNRIVFLPDGITDYDINDVGDNPIVFTTTSEREALIWCRTMMSQGYTTIIYFDETTGVYTCIATHTQPGNLILDTIA